MIRTIASIFVLVILVFPAALPREAIAQDADLPSLAELKRLSVEELMRIDVTLASRRPQRYLEAPAALQILTNETIRRSGATRLPEALRLAPNLQVAQVNSHDWAITSRGFNGAPLSTNSLANKLLVMIDGRTVYTPLFGGVFWDVQNVMLADIDRVEVISGPGGTLWGANAVNGIINVATRSADRTHGVFATASTGTYRRSQVGLRYGGRVGEDLHFRIFGQRHEYGETRLMDGATGNDDFAVAQGGFRMDFFPGFQTTLTLQGDAYSGRENTPTSVEVNGQNVLFRWTSTFSPESDIQLQGYFDRTWRELSNSDFTDEMQSYDVDFQHRFPVGARNDLVWGAGYRHIRNDAQNSPTLSLIPPNMSLNLLSAFVQNEFTLVEDRLKLTTGSKIERNDYTGFEVQPSARLAWFHPDAHTIWTAVSRAIRSPSRFDTDVLTRSLIGDPDFKSESVTAYELGYRTQPTPLTSISASVYYNVYRNLRSINFNPGGDPLYTFRNDHEAESWGFELMASAQPFSFWRVRGGYTYLDKSLRSLSDLVVPGGDAFEAIDPNHQVILHSMFDLPGNLHLDVMNRFVDGLDATAITPEVDPYLEMNLRLAFNHQAFEFAIIGQNLLGTAHREFGPRSMPRSVLGKVTWQF
jgi:iron complex outermembrane recepter protein